MTFLIPNKHLFDYRYRGLDGILIISFEFVAFNTVLFYY